MTGLQLKTAILRSLNVTAPSQAPAYVHDDVAIAVNTAFQEIWQVPNSAHSTRSHWEFQTIAGSPSYILTQSVLELLGPVRADGVHLRRIETSGNFDNYTQRFGCVDPSQNARPTIFYLDRTWQNANDSAKNNMKFWPTPDATYQITYEAKIEPPNLTACDLESGLTVIPVPHNFAETTILPIARYHAGRSTWFHDPVLQAKFDQDYQKALASIGALDTTRRPAEGKEAA